MTFAPLLPAAFPVLASAADAAVSDRKHHSEAAANRVGREISSLGA